MPRLTHAHYTLRNQTAVAVKPAPKPAPKPVATTKPAPKPVAVAAPKPAPKPVAPKPVVAIVPPPPPPPPPPQVRRRALCIGINYVGTTMQLAGCINDQENIAAALVASAAFAREEIVLMTDYLSGSAYPTLSNIWAQLDGLRQWAAQWPSTVPVQLFVSYSGHGTRRVDFSRDEPDYYDEAIVPLDYRSAGLIKDDDLRQRFIELLPANVTLVMVADACNSGSIADLRYAYNLATPRVVSTNAQYPETACTCILLSAAHDWQTAADVWLPDPVTGIYEVQGGLSSAFSKFYNRTTPILQLVETMKQWVLAQSLTQVTQLSSSRLLADTTCFFPAA